MKNRELTNPHIQNILSLTSIPGKNPVRINVFYKKLMTSVQSLDTIVKLKEITGCARTTLDKLPGIRADLVKVDRDWLNWVFGAYFKIQSHISKYFNIRSETWKILLQVCTMMIRYQVVTRKKKDYNLKSACLHCISGTNCSFEFHEIYHETI